MPVKKTDLFTVRKGRRRQGLIIADNYEPGDTATFKSCPILHPQSTDVRPISYACHNCFQYAKDSVHNNVKGLGIRNCFLVSTMDPTRNTVTRFFPYLFHFWNKADLASKYKLVTIEEVKPLLFADLFNIWDIVPDAPNNVKMLNESQKASYDARLKEIEGYLENFIVKPVGETCIRFLIRFVSVLLGSFFRLIFDSVNVHKGSIEILREVQKTNLPIIYISTSRSGLDQFLLSWTLLNYNIQPPVFPISNSTLKTPVLGRLSKLIGGFGCLKDPLESQSFVLPNHELKGPGIGIYYYLHSLIKNGNPVVFPIEEGRSRTGLVSTEAYGYEYLGVLFDLLLNKDIEDAVIVPVNISYEKLPEDGILNENKSFFNFYHIRRSFKSLLTLFTKDLGTARVDFAQPFHLKDFEAISHRFEFRSEDDNWNLNPKGIYWTPHHACDLNYAEKYGSVSSLNSSALILSCSVSLPKPEEQNELFKQYRSTVQLTYHLLNDVQNCGSFMCTHLLAFILLKKHRRGLHFEDLVDEMNDLADFILLNKRDLGFRRTNMEKVTKRAIQLLGTSLVEMKKVDKKLFVKPILNEGGLVKLNYYASHLLHLLVNDAVMSLSILHLIRNNFGEDLIAHRGLDREFKVPCKEVQLGAMKLMDMLHGEFLFHLPCENSENRVFKSIESFRTTCDISLDKITIPFRASQLEFEDDNWGSDNEVSCSLSCDRMIIKSTHEVTLFLSDNAKLILPYFEMYGVMAKVLLKLLDGPMKRETLLVLMYDTIKTYNEENTKNWDEYLSYETARKFLMMLKKQGTIYLEFSKETCEFYYQIDSDYASEEAILEIALTYFDSYLSI